MALEEELNGKKRKREPWRRESNTHVLARKIQLVRERRGLSLNEASKLTGVAISTLSKIENGKMSPTFDVVTRIMKGLRISPAFLFKETGEFAVDRPAAVDRRKEPIVISIPSADYEILCADSVPKDMFPTIVTLHSSAHHELVAYAGEEFIMVIEGELEIVFEGSENIRLEKNECLYFDSTLPHSFCAVGNKFARFLAVSNRTALEGNDTQDNPSTTTARRLRQLILK